MWKEYISNNRGWFPFVSFNVWRNKKQSCSTGKKKATCCIEFFIPKLKYSHIFLKTNQALFICLLHQICFYRPKLVGVVGRRERATEKLILKQVE